MLSVIPKARDLKTTIALILYISCYVCRGVPVPEHGKDFMVARPNFSSPNVDCPELEIIGVS